MESYEKLELEGRYDVVRGFAAGWAAGRGWSREEMAHRIIWPAEWHIQVDSRMQELVDVISPESDCVVLVRNDTIPDFLEALSPWERRLSLTLKSRRQIDSASFRFSFEFFSRDEANVVRQMFENLPEGVSMSDDYQPIERSDSTAHGAELYAPVHEYSFSGHGTVSGDLRGVLHISERAHQHERVKRKSVQLQLGS
jgi:hypothetical protein